MDMFKLGNFLEIRLYSISLKKQYIYRLFRYNLVERKNKVLKQNKK